MRAVCTFEIRQQLREPLTTLYALVFFLLALGFTASDAVQLVNDRGAVPANSPWSLALAFGGLTAFGQVITTMVVATTMLRDDALRTRALVATSGVSTRDWFLARFAAALVVLSAVYAAMPLGAAIGARLSAFTGNEVAWGGVTRYLRAFALISLPTMVVVAGLLAAAGALTRRILGVLAMALLLVGIWQLALALEGHPRTRLLGALLDPFANAPVLTSTRGWTETQRRTREIPIDARLAGNRLLWLTIAAAATAVAARRVTWAVPEAGAGHPPTAPSERMAAHEPEAATAKHRTTGVILAVRSVTTKWMMRDGGWRVITVLAVLNALINGWAGTGSAVSAGSASGTPTSLAGVLGAVSTHSRLFLILLATVYAGELHWRDRDVRVDALIDSSPAPTWRLGAGRLMGMLVAQLSLVAPLAVGALLIALARGACGGSCTGAAGGRALEEWSAWTVFVLWLPFVHLTVLSAAVHAILDHKVGAHLLLILGWVLAVVLNTQGANGWWYRFAEPAVVLHDGHVAWVSLAQRGAYWSAVSAALTAVLMWRLTSRR